MNCIREPAFVEPMNPEDAKELINNQSTCTIHVLIEPSAMPVLLPGTVCQNIFRWI